MISNFVRQQTASQVKSLSCVISNSFSSSLAANNYVKFKTKYNEHVKAFEEKMRKVQDENRPPLKKPFSKAYTHPYHNDHHPLNFSAVKLSELASDFVGPEMVSPHYENFAMSRKYAIIFFGGVIALMVGISTTDISWFAKSSFIPFVFWLQLHYIFLEGRKSFFKPLLVRFYRRVAAVDMYNFDLFYHENMEVSVREQMRVAKEQLEYMQIHEDFNDIKAESINNFLANEYINLQRHIADRAVNILKQAQMFEDINKNRFLQNIITEATAEIDKALEGPQKEEIQNQMLESAIRGLAKGYMDYEGDPILPLVQKVIRRNVEKFTKLSAEEQKKLLSLTDAQLSTLKQMDKRAKEEYLHTEPKGLDASLKQYDVVKKMLASWGK
eukprot:CAMPEP_0176430664 /NCGR_PEP_ID=MMETSP0127-20121128/14378_1 /TAXON_ID=938130 /ORGANISM="Platyophrya macrostoma, Strain WH" /LENGTH=383 /DNA_ID=CAMNT_0017812577 /DNA_START=37 /DNA_END=1188 /DNA_ORIENTATION=+